jgi:hypothetical protein
LGAVSRIVVLAVPDSTFAAVNFTVRMPLSVAAGVQVSLPVVPPVPAVNSAPGRFVAVRVVIASPSGSDAPTVTTTVSPA